MERGWCYNQSRDGAPAHAAGGPGGVSAPPQGPRHRACRRPGRSPRPDRKELHSRCTSSGNWWVTSPICFSPGKDSCTRQAVTGLLLEKNCWLRHGGTHANRIGPKRSAKLAVRDCQPIKGVTIFHSNRGSQYTSADYTATMNKYGFLTSAGRTGVCHVQRRSRYHSTPPVQERTRQPAGSTTPEEKQSKR